MFILYLTAAANSVCKGAGRQTLSEDDVYAALADIQFSEFVAPLQASAKGEKFPTNCWSLSDLGTDPCRTLDFQIRLSMHCCFVALQRSSSAGRPARAAPRQHRRQCPQRHEHARSIRQLRAGMSAARRLIGSSASTAGVVAPAAVAAASV